MAGISATTYGTARVSYGASTNTPNRTGQTSSGRSGSSSGATQSRASSCCVPKAACCTTGKAACCSGTYSRPTNSTSSSGAKTLSRFS